MRYLRHSKFFNENYVSSNCSFSIIGEGIFRPFYFTGRVHGNFNGDCIIPHKDKFFSRDKYLGATEYKIYEEYKTEREYQEAINKYLLLGELVS